MRRRLPSLRERLLRDVLAPLGLTWLAGTVVAAATALVFAQRAFDRSLLDDAYVLAANTRLQAGQLELALNRRELGTALFDQAESTYFAVRDRDGDLVAGHPGLVAQAPDPEDGPFRFDSIDFAGLRLRAVTLRLDGPAPFEVTVAQTTRGRTALVQQLMLFSLLPQMLLLVLLALWLRRSISQDVQALSRLEDAVENRDADDLRPVEVAAGTHDVGSVAAAINALLARLERSLRAQREFSGNVAHELRTPLAGIRALAAYGLARTDPQVWREQLAAIAASEARASRLVDKLLALAMAAEAEAGLRLAPIPLEPLVREAVLRFLPRADAAGVDLGAQGLDDPVQVMGDAALVEGILDNLLDNALRYGVSPHERATVTVTLEQRADGIVLGVQDNGPGQPDATQAQLLERGVQGETGELLGQGAGLGLALVAQYARLMKAHFELGAGPGGRGWAARVRFPRMPG